MLLAQELMTFDFVPFSSPNTQWLFFYSKKGVEYFLQQSNFQGFKLAAFAPKTAKFIREKTNCDLDFVGDGKAENTASMFVELVKEDSVCFVIGRNSLRSVQGQFKDRHSWTELIVYDQKIKKDLKLAHYDLAILTSPMNVQAFIENMGTSTHFFSIGLSTYQELKGNNLDSLIADRASEESLCLLVEEFLSGN